MSQEDPTPDDAFDGFDEQKRGTSARLTTGTSYVAPIVVSFAMEGMSIAGATGLGHLTSNGSGHRVSNFTSDVRLKTGMARIGSHPAGFGIYRFRYRGSDAEYVGVIAQEVLEKVPEAVSASPSGLLSVDYRALGIEMTRFDA